MKITCPYTWCSAGLNLKHQGEDPQGWNADRLEGSELENVSPLIIPLHPIDHHALTGNCPASLMHYPIRRQSRHQEILDECAANDKKRLDEWVDSVLSTNPQEVTDRPESTVVRPLFDRLGRAKLPGRMGREPTTPQDEKDWVLGGRQDEDAGPTPVWHNPPPNVLGQGVGKVSVQETLAALNSAAIEIGQCLATVSEEREIEFGASVTACEQARASVQGAKGDVHVETLDQYIGLLLQAEEDFRVLTGKAESAREKLMAALSLGEDYGNRAMG